MILAFAWAAGADWTALFPLSPPAAHFIIGVWKCVKSVRLTGACFSVFGRLRVRAKAATAVSCVGL